MEPVYIEQHMPSLILCNGRSWHSCKGAFLLTHGGGFHILFEDNNRFTNFFTLFFIRWWTLIYFNLLFTGVYYSNLFTLHWPLDIVSSLIIGHLLLHTLTIFIIFHDHLHGILIFCVCYWLWLLYTCHNYHVVFVYTCMLCSLISFRVARFYPFSITLSACLLTRFIAL